MENYIHLYLGNSNMSIQHTSSRTALPPLAFHSFRILTAVAMAISIVGITSSMSAEGPAHPDIKIKIGMILYLVSWAQLVMILLVLVVRRESLERGEHRTLLAVAISSPFILVRVIYAFLVWFLHDATFSMIDGNVTVHLVMSVLEEFAVAIVCLGVGLTLRVRVRETRGGQEAALPAYSNQDVPKP